MRGNLLNFAKFIPSFLCVAVLGCKNPAQTNLAHPLEVGQVIPAPPVQADVSRQEGRPPMNCPAMLVSHSNFSTRFNEQYLSFALRDNPDFDFQKGDACQGDIKNLWTDLLRFEAEIEEHVPNIRGIHDVDRGLKYFPKTEREFKTFINDAAMEAGLPSTLDFIDRSALEGGMKVDHTIIWFIIENEKTYFAREHAPIIEAVLSKYGLKMKPYETEKLGYCYHPYEICRAPNNDAPKSEQTDFKLERLSPGFSWYEFEKPN